MRKFFEFWIHLFFIGFPFFGLYIAWFFFHSHTCRACLVSWEVSWKERRGSLEMSNGMQWRHLVHLTLHALDVSSSCKDLNVPERWDGTDGTSDGRRNSQDIRGTEALWASPLPKQLHCRRWKTRHARCWSLHHRIRSFQMNLKFWMNLSASLVSGHICQGQVESAKKPESPECIKITASAASSASAKRYEKVLT